MLGRDLLLAPDRLRREPPLEFLELLDDPCWRLRKHHRAQREYRSDLDRDEAVALRPGSVGRATPIRCGHCLGGEASREWRIILKRLCDLARRSILARCRSRDRKSTRLNSSH